MPLSKYYEGSGKKVMASMKKTYGAEKGERVFYATANKRGENPGKRRRSHFPNRRHRY